MEQELQRLKRENAELKSLVSTHQASIRRLRKSSKILIPRRFRDSELNVLVNEQGFCGLKKRLLEYEYGENVSKYLSITAGKKVKGL